MSDETEEEREFRIACNMSIQYLDAMDDEAFRALVESCRAATPEGDRPTRIARLVLNLEAEDARSEALARDNAELVDSVNRKHGQIEMLTKERREIGILLAGEQLAKDVIAESVAKVFTDMMAERREVEAERDRVQRDLDKCFGIMTPGQMAEFGTDGLAEGGQ